MPNPSDFLPQPPWEGPPIPKSLGKPKAVTPSDLGRAIELEAQDWDKLNEINRKWRELDNLQISACIHGNRWVALNALDALGLELSKKEAVKYYIEEK